MIERVISFSIKNKFIIGLFVFALIGWGIYSLTQLPIDAIPDVTNNQVQIISVAPALATQEVESFVTAPIEVAVANIPDIIELRSISRLGLSVITVVFKDNVDVYWARQQLSERIKEAEESIPEGLAKIELAPVSSGLGEIYQYRLAVQKGFESKFSSMDLRTLQDWTIRREMLGTPGVADINSYGGFVRQYEVAVNPEKLRSFSLTLHDVFNALQKNNENTGSAYIDKNPTAYFIRGIGLVKNLDDIGKIVIRNNTSGVPVLISDVAKVQYGNATRYGAFVVDTTEAVGGVVMMLKGENAHEVINEVENRIKSIQKSLPDGVTIEPFLNRSDLVGRSIGTVSKNLIEGALIVIFILILLLGNFRAGLIVASVIPLSMLFAISLMRVFGVSGNLMSLGAIDFGLIVDGSVIIVESILHHITKSSSVGTSSGILTQKQMDVKVFTASSRIRTAATFGEIIILIVYLPLLALTGIEGKMFQPMALVVCFAILGAFILSLTYVPMISALFLSKRTKRNPNFSDKIMEKMHTAFNPIFLFSLKHKIKVSISAVVVFMLSLIVFNNLGGEFIPQLEEGDLAAGVMTLQGGSLSNTVEVVKKANKILLDNFPEIKHTVCKIGTGEIPTDPTPMETGDYIITLKDKSEWTSAKTREELVELIEEKLIVLAGVKFEFQQPIQMRFNELLSGSRQDVAVNIYGDNLDKLASKANEVEKIIRRIEGVEDINVEKVTGLAQIHVEYNRDRIAQYGLSIAELNLLLRTAFAGSKAGVVFDEEKRFDLVVRLDKDYRQNLDDVKNMTIALPNGSQIPFEHVAAIEIKSAPAQVSRENTKRRITVGFNVRNRDVESVITEVNDKIDANIKLPTSYFINYGGQYQNLKAAKGRLMIAVPIALLLIVVLLYFTFHSVRQSVLIFTAVPMSAIGGILALWLRDMNFSISAGVGFIALFGVAVLNGIVLISEFNRLEKEGVSDITERVLKGLHTRLRPVIITAAVASLGFLPMALSTSAGAEVQKPLATVVIGGLITATLLTLIVLPIFYILFSEKKNYKQSSFQSIVSILIITALFGTSSISNLNAQEIKVINLNQAIQLARDSNLFILSANYSVDIQKARKGAAWNIPKTEISGEYGQLNSYSKDNSFSVSQSFAFPTVYLQQNKLAKAQLVSSIYERKVAEINVVTQVKQVYWQIAYLHSTQQLLVWQDSLYTGFLRAAELRLKAGETNKLEMISARTQQLETLNKLEQIVSDINTMNQKLQTLLNIKTPVVTADTSLYKIEMAFAADKALNANPMNGYMLQQIEISKRERQVEISKMLPDLTVGYFSQTMKGEQDVNGIQRTFGAGDRFAGIQAGISIPVFFNANRAEIKAAKIKEMQMLTNAEHYSKTVQGNYQSLLNEYSKYSKNVDFYEKQALKEADFIIRQATMSYRAGDMDYLDYIQNLNQAISIKQNYLEVLNNYNQTIISIEFLLGDIN